MKSQHNAALVKKIINADLAKVDAKVAKADVKRTLNVGLANTTHNAALASLINVAIVNLAKIAKPPAKEHLKGVRPLARNHAKQAHKPTQRQAYLLQ